MILGLFIAMGGLALAQSAPATSIEQVVASPPPLVLADTPLVFGFVRAVEPPAQSMPMSLVAWDADTLEERWRVADTGDFMADMAPRFAHLARVGDVVVLAQPNRVLRGLSITDGSERWSITLEDRPTRACALDGAVYVEVIDQKHQRLDPATGTVAPLEALPKACSVQVPVSPVSALGPPARPVRRVEEGLRLVPSGQALRYALVEADGRGVAILQKQPGTPIPGVGRVAEGDVRWARTLFPSDPFAPRAEEPGPLALTDEVAVLSYRLQLGQSRLQAFDRKTGAVLWDVAAPHDAHEISSLQIRGERILIGSWTFLDAVDLKTGASVASVGRWN